VHITVVGAGVTGLSSALALEERGHVVTIVAAATGDATTSAVAGAIWFPYKAGPPDKVAAWAARTHAWLDELADKDRDAGVDRVTCYEITSPSEPDDVVPWWALGIAVTREPAPVAGAPPAWKFIAPRVEPARFLPWLTSRLHATIEIRTVDDLASLPGDVVVNCTGLGARDLATDERVMPLLGQIAVVDPGAADLGTSITDDRGGDEIFYAIPRRDEIVLGGCSRPIAPGVVPQEDRALTERIVRQARSLGIAAGAVRRVRVGLRPYRDEVRLERTGRIIHNYGHGGAGFTLCRGCAEDVVALVEAGGATA
jgi:D-amino-acid oxidase